MDNTVVKWHVTSWVPSDMSFFGALRELSSWCGLPLLARLYLQNECIFIFSSCCMIWSCCMCIITLKKLYICHPPPPFCMAFSHNSFSRLTAFCLRVKSSTARFLLHRKFVSLWMRSGSWFTWAPTDAEMDERQRVSTNEAGQKDLLY